jgi:hypothetical protein
MAAPISIDDVREEMLDREADDHLVLAKLAFEDTDIEYAMKACARTFNSFQPYVGNATWDNLPLNSSVFFDGIAWALFRRWHRNVSMNDLDYSAGGLEANVQASLLKNLEGLREESWDKFEKRSMELKIHMNLADAYGIIG